METGTYSPQPEEDSMHKFLIGLAVVAAQGAVFYIAMRVVGAADDAICEKIAAKGEDAPTPA